MPDRIWTYDLLLRKQTLYPAELRAHVVWMLMTNRNIHLEIKWASPLGWRYYYTIIFQDWLFFLFAFKGVRVGFETIAVRDGVEEEEIMERGEGKGHVAAEENEEAEAGEIREYAVERGEI